MAGGAGNDYYHVDDAGDIVIEGVGQGTDHVFSTIDYLLADNVENLNLVQQCDNRQRQRAGQ